MHKLGLIGGTFDRFHLGHKKLINDALLKCMKIEIWIISDEIATKNNPTTNSWIIRRDEIIDNLDYEQIEKITFGILNDDHGPAPTHIDATAIICSNETRKICLEINEIRLKNSLEKLEIIEIGHVKAWDKIPISSTRIRNGEINREGEPWNVNININNQISIWDSEILNITDEVIRDLKKPFGELISGPEKKPEYAMGIAINKYRNENVPLIAVGDVSVLTLERLNYPPEIALIDGKTKRKIWIESEEIKFDNYDEIIKCHNLAGELTPALFNACKKSINSWLNNKNTTLISIDGEEDLAPLIIHLLAPLGSVVIYGQPKKGVVVRITEEETKRRCKMIIEKFDSKNN